MAMAVLRGDTPALDLPPSGRSSDETLGSAMSGFVAQYGSISPVISFELLKTLKCLWLYNPDFSQYVANIVNLGNPGHSISVDARTDAGAEAAVARLNESASRIYPQGCGVDGLIDQYLTSIAVFGAISSEDVVNVPARRVEKVVLVPVEQIRFQYDKELDAYVAYQKSNRIDRTNPMGLVRLNAQTYKYFALQTVENSPYAKPPATAAVEAIIEGQQPIMQNLRWAAQKYGILGLVAVSVAQIAKRGGESPQEFERRMEQHIANYAEKLSGSFNKGLIVMPKPNTIDTTSVGAAGQGLAEVNTVSEQQVISGLNTQGVFLGRSDSSTETFADVVFYLQKAQAAKMQRVVKRRVETTYRLDLRLGGIEVDGVSVQFDKAHSRNAKEEAETDEIKFRDVLARVKAGMITPDEAAHDMGEESWADEALLFQSTGIAPAGPSDAKDQLAARLARKTIRLSFDKFSQRYRYQPERIEIWSGDAEEAPAADNVVPIKKKAHQA